MGIAQNFQKIATIVEFITQIVCPPYQTMRDVGKMNSGTPLI